MRILRVTPYYYPSLGGIERHVQALSEGLRANGHVVVVATMAHEKGLPREEVIGGVTVHRFRAFGPRQYRIPLGLIRYLRRQAPRFDVVHAHNIHDSPLLIALATCQRPIVVSTHYHGRGRAHSRPANVAHRVYDPIVSRLLARAGSVICQSHGEADLLRQSFGLPQERLVVVPSGAPSLGQPGEPVAGETSHLLLSVGRLEPHKRVDRLIAAIPFLPEEVSLAIVGSGPEKERLEAMAAALDLGRRVAFLGQVDDDELKVLYRTARVVISLSEAESFGMTVLEGLAAGCRVVCSDIPAFRDFAVEFPSAVSLVPSSADARQEAEVLHAAVCAAGRVEVDLQQYSWPEILRRTTNIYQSVSTANRASRPPLHQEVGQS
jgi:glycosyltransferase involved in cell wall biosynthesis